MSAGAETWSSFQVREELESLLERDLLGPWDGPEEELAPGTIPAERYLLGRLVPRIPDAGQPVPEPTDDDAFHDPGLVDTEATVDADDNEDRESESTTRSGSMSSSALGVSFVVPDDVTTVRVDAAWGRYRRAQSRTHQSEQGRPRSVWRRQPAGGSVDVPVHDEGTGKDVPDAEQEGVVVTWTVRHTHLGRAAVRIVHVALVNALPPLSSTPDENRLYQAGLQVTALDGQAAIFAGHNDAELVTPPPVTDGERAHLALLHRASRRYAVGSQCAVDADVRAGERRAWRLRTTCFPAAEVWPVVPGGAAATNVVLDMNRLGNPELAGDDLVAGLSPLVSGYRTWLDDQEARLGADAPDGDSELGDYEAVARAALVEARAVADRLERAVELLRVNGQAREAFRFANQAMARQRVRGELVRRRVADPEQSVAELLRELDVPRNRSWRPFQLAFVLLCLPGLTDPAHPDAQRGADDGTVQLLFFPTGGGKTEAYLGLTAYALAIRRLQGVVGTGDEVRDGSDGVAAQEAQAERRRRRLAALEKHSGALSGAQHAYGRDHLTELREDWPA